MRSVFNDRIFIKYRYAKYYISLKMKNIIGILGLVIIALSACKKEEPDTPPPTIRFVEESGFVFQDTLLALGETFKIGILADNPAANLTNFIIRVETDDIETFLDSGMNAPSLSYEKSIQKGIKESEKWTFIIRDRSSNSSQISLIIKRDTSAEFGNIQFHPSVELGAQSNSTASFYSLAEAKVYAQEEAFLNQDKIDFCYYYDFIDTDENTIASPGANIDESVFPGENGLSKWSIRLTSRFKLSDVTEEEFDQAINDSLLLAAYGQSDGNRKAKNLQGGKIFAFKNEDGKVGLFLVNSISGTDEGKVNISIKVQE